MSHFIPLVKLNNIQIVVIINRDAPILNFSTDTGSRLFIMISAVEDTDSLVFIFPTNAVNYTENPFIWYITIILEFRIF